MKCRNGDGLEAGAEDGLEGGKLRISGGRVGSLWSDLGQCQEWRAGRRVKIAFSVPGGPGQWLSREREAKLLVGEKG